MRIVGRIPTEEHIRMSSSAFNLRPDKFRFNEIFEDDGLGDCDDFENFLANAEISCFFVSGDFSKKYKNSEDM